MSNFEEPQRGGERATAWLTAPRVLTGIALALLWATYVWAARHANVVLLLWNSDTWAHLAAIRRTVELGPFPGDLFYLGEPTPPYYSLSHILFAWLTALSGTPAHELLLAAPTVLVVADIGAVFLFLHGLTRDRRVAVVGAAVELTIYMPAPAWWALTYPRNFALSPFYFAWYAYLRGRTERRPWWLAASGLSLGLCLATHLFTGGICLLGLALLDRALSRDWRRSVAPLFLVTACALAVSSPWIGSFAHAWQQRPPVSDRAFQSLWEGWTLAPDLGLRILRPGVVFQALPGPLWLAMALATAQAARRLWSGNASSADRFAVMATVAGLTLVLTPLFGIAVMAFGVWAQRLLLLVPFSLLVGLGVALLLDVLGARADDKWPWPARAAALCLLGWIGFAAVNSVTSTADQWASVSERMRTYGPIGSWDLEARLAQTGPLPLEVLADPDTSYLLPYFLGSYVVSAPAAHGSPYLNHSEREAAVREFFRASTPRARLYEILEERGVDMVAVVPSSAWPGQDLSATLLRRLRGTPGFVDTGCCDQTAFVRFVGRPAARRRGARQP